MGREFALAHGRNAELAASRGGSVPSTYAAGQMAGARPAVTFAEAPPDSLDGSCSATARGGTACKAHPVTGTSLCIGHTRQKVAAE